MQNAPALQTLLSRSAHPDLTSSSALPPSGHTTSSLLSDLFDTLKNTPPTLAAQDAVAKRYGLDGETVRGLKKWVNSPSVDKDKTVVKVDENGEESVQMTVGGFCVFLHRLLYFYLPPFGISSSFLQSSVALEQRPISKYFLILIRCGDYLIFLSSNTSRCAIKLVLVRCRIADLSYPHPLS